MQVLVHYGKHGDEYWLADTPQRLTAAMFRLFTLLDDSGCFSGLDDKTLTRARLGDMALIRAILKAHQRNEYESWELKDVRDPCTP